MRNQVVAYICNQVVAKIAETMETRRDVFQAIADPTRRAIVALIAMQAMTPNALAENFQTSRQAISRHLQVLAECQMVTAEPKGREMYYQLNPATIKEVDDWLQQFRKLWENRFTRLDEVLTNMKHNTQTKS